MQITDSNGNVYETTTSTIVTPGTGPLTITKDAMGNWTDSATGKILLNADGTRPACGCNGGFHKQALPMFVAGVIALLIIIWLLKSIFRG